MAWANERLARHQRLAGVEFRDEFPRNALGKVLKRLLREPYWAAYRPRHMNPHEAPSAPPPRRRPVARQSRFRGVCRIALEY